MRNQIQYENFNKYISFGSQTSKRKFEIWIIRIIYGNELPFYFWFDIFDVGGGGVEGVHS